MFAGKGRINADCHRFPTQKVFPLPAKGIAENRQDEGHIGIENHFISSTVRCFA
jgi:hypothetical protein